MTRTRRIVALLGALAALPAVAGCYSGSLTVDVNVVREMNSLAYLLEPTGRLTVTEGSGLGERGKGRELYATHVDMPAMRQLKKIVYKSVFLVASQPIKGSLTGGGMFMIIKAKLGMWENDMHLRGTNVESAAEITSALDKHLPERYRIRYSAAPALRSDEDYRKYMDP